MNEKRTALLVLDLDGTVRKGFSELGRFVNGAAGVEVFPEVVPLMRKWKEAGGRIVGATNQGGIALGLVTKEKVTEAATETDRQCDNLFDIIAICHHHPEAKDPEHARCWCRKPAPGLVIEAGRDLRDRYGEIYPTHMGLFIGDMDVDEECAEALNMDFMWAAEWRASGNPNISPPKTKPPRITDGQKRLLRGLVEAGGSGVFDRWVCIVAGGEKLTSHGSTTVTTAFRHRRIRMRGERVEITSKGRQLLGDAE